MATTPGLRASSSSAAASTATRVASPSSRGVGTLVRSRIRPSSVTTPPAILVPPMSMPIARGSTRSAGGTALADVDALEAVPGGVAGAGRAGPAPARGRRAVGLGGALQQDLGRQQQLGAGLDEVLDRLRPGAAQRGQSGAERADLALGGLAGRSGVLLGHGRSSGRRWHQAPLAPADGPSRASKRTVRVPPRRLAVAISSGCRAWGRSTLRLYWPTRTSSSSPLRWISRSPRSANGRSMSRA